jgi:outer membrane biosynthesis protein TonB
VVIEAREPRMSVGVLLSVLLHGGLVAAFILNRPGPPPPSPPMFRVQLIAAPRAAPAAGVVQAPPAPAPVKPLPSPIQKKAPERTIPPVKRTPAARPAPTSASIPAPPTKTAPAPPAGSTTGGRGTDAADLVTPGIEFPYPYYINNIANVLIRHFNAIHSGRAPLSAMVRFTIRRDGTVDPESIRMVTPSRVYTFDQDALAAVEAAANANAFGPLPPGFREDILPVQFRFNPAVLR